MPLADTSQPHSLTSSSTEEASSNVGEQPKKLPRLKEIPGVMIPDDRSIQTGPIQPSEDIQSDLQPPVHVGRRIALIILGIFLLAASILIISHFWRQGDIPRLLNFVPQTPTPGNTSTRLLDARNGVAVMVKQPDESRSQVIIKQVNQVGTRDISDNAVFATNPALSPDGTQVAYLSRGDTAKIVFSPILSGTAEHYITDRDLQVTQTLSNVNPVKVCAWTPIVWRPTGDSVAFFACKEDGSLSIVVIAKAMSGNLVSDPLLGSEAYSKDERQLQWMDNDNLIVTIPITDARSGSPVKVLAVSPSAP